MPAVFEQALETDEAYLSNTLDCLTEVVYSVSDAFVSATCIYVQEGSSPIFRNFFLKALDMDDVKPQVWS